MNRVCIKTYGCQMNKAESAALETIMREHGWIQSPEAEGADLILLPGSKHSPTDLAWLRERGMLINLGPVIRLVTHLDVSRDDMVRFADAVGMFMQQQGEKS